MSTRRDNHTTGVGRIVKGDVFAGYDKDYDGVPYTDKKTGEAVMRYSVGIAFAKTDPATDAMLAYMQKCGNEDCGTLASHPSFSWKHVDGDSVVPDLKGVKPCDKDGYAGHHVITFTQPSRPPRVVDENQVDIGADSGKCARGSYVRVCFDVKGHTQNAKPGIYVTHKLVQHCGYGVPLAGGIDVGAALAAPVGAAPAGMSATPLAPAMAPPAAAPPAAGAPAASPFGAPPAPTPHAAPQAPAPVAGPPAAPAPAPAVPGAPVAPVANFGAAPPPPAAVAPPPAAPAPVGFAAPAGWAMAPAAAASHADYLAAGWTHEQLVAQGLVAPG
jgi:hypothetical protein